MAWDHQRVVVTGAGGFIGSHLVERLVALGAETTAFVHYNAAGSWGWLDDSPCAGHINVVLGDISDRGSIRDAVRGADVVFHLAALVGIPFSYQAPLLYVRTNIEGSMNVFQAALEAGARRVVHTSTSEVYGTAQRVPISEDHQLRAQSPYAASKIGADQMAEAFHRSYALPVATVRPFNCFGPRQSARAVIPTIISQALDGHRITLGHLAPARDFTFVLDTVEAFLLAAESPAAVGAVVNVGSGREISIEALARVILDLVGADLEIHAEPQRERPAASEVQRLMADVERADKLLGWHPRVNLRDGLGRTIDWIREHRRRFRPGVYAI